MASGNRGSPVVTSGKGNPLCLRGRGNGGMWSRPTLLGSSCRDQRLNPCHEQHVDGLRRQRGLGCPLSRHV
eukprot:5275564-Ditylum_brightwellii.AAC.1